MYCIADISQFESLMNDTTAVINNRVVVDNGFVDYARNLLKPKREPKPEKLGKIKYGWKSRLASQLLEALLLAGGLGSYYGGLHQLEMTPATVTPTMASRVVSEHCKSPVDQLTRYLVSNPDWMKNTSGWLARKTGKLGRWYAENNILKMKNGSMINLPPEIKQNPNYQAAMKRCAECLAASDLSPTQSGSYVQGFELFGRICAALDVDLYKQIPKINVNINYDNSIKREFTYGDTIYVNANTNAGVITHELLHTLPYFSQAVRNIMSQPGLLIGRMLDDVNLGNDKRQIIKSYPLDVWRSFVSGQLYPGKGYLNDPMRTTLASTELDSDIDYVYGMLSRQRPTTPRQNEYNDEYLSMFASQYMDMGSYKPPLLYAMSIKKNMDEINKESRKIGTAYWSLDKRLADEITQTSKKMLINGMLRKLPMGEVLVQVKENAKNMASAYMDQKGKKIRQEFMW